METVAVLTSERTQWIEKSEVSVPFSSVNLIRGQLAPHVTSYFPQKHSMETLNNHLLKKSP